MTTPHTKSNEDKPREFWIEHNCPRRNFIVYEEKVDGLDEHAYHVIEYSAYEALEAKCAKYEAALKFLRDNRIHDTRVTVVAKEALEVIESEK